jgi:AcrR family transcriptional regulator
MVSDHRRPYRSEVTRRECSHAIDPGAGCVSDLTSLLDLPAEQWPTRELILREASRLFATRGYLGTSTREIAAAVGIQQPSLYNHFSSKQAIAEALLEFDLGSGLAFMRPLLAEDGGAGERLYRYVLFEVTHCMSSPYDLRALYLSELLEQPEFARGRAMLDEYEASIRKLIELGIAAGEFVEIDPGFAHAAVDAIVVDTMRREARYRANWPQHADCAASFLLRGLLRRPSALRSIRTSAHRHFRP